MTRRGRVQAHRTGSLRLSLPSVLVFIVVVCALAPLTLEPVGIGLPIWVSAALVGAVSFVALFVPIRGRVLLVEWIVAMLAFWRGRKRSLVDELPAVTDIKVIAGTAGVRWDGYTVVSAVEIMPTAALTYQVGPRAITDSVLPLSLMASLMSHHDLNIDIDIMSSGRHVPSGSAYRTVYSQILGARPLVGQRRTWLILRLDAKENLADIVARGPSGIAAPKALVSATYRVVQRLQQEGIRAYALSAHELDDLTAILLKPIGAVDNRERWGAVESGQNFVSTYVSDPAGLNVEQLDRWWSWCTEDVVVMLRLSRVHTNEVKVGSVVRYVTHGKAYRPLSELNLTLPTAVQRLLLMAPLPAGDRSLEVELPSTSISHLVDFSIPIGPSGQLLGQSDDGTMVAVPLWDQSGQPQRRRIEARIGAELAHQLILRAVVTGAVVGIHTNSPSRWDNLVAAVGDSSRLFYAATGMLACDIAVFDGCPVTTVQARTVMRLLDLSAAFVGSADMTMVEMGGQSIEITVGSYPPQLVRTIRSREEDRYLGHAAPEGEPRRWASAKPSLTRTTRAPEVSTTDLAPIPASGDLGAGALADEDGTARQRNIAGHQHHIARGGRLQRGVGRLRRQTRQFRLPQDTPPEGQPTRRRRAENVEVDGEGMNTSARAIEAE